MDGREKDAFNLYFEAAKKGHVKAEYKVAICFIEGKLGQTKNEGKAFIWLKKREGKGCFYASLKLVFAYRLGEFNLTVNENKSHKLFIEIRKQLDSIEIDENLDVHRVGLIYLKGLGNQPKNFQKAFEYFKLGAARKNRESNFYLGCMYVQSLGVDKDYEKALMHFTLAVNQGDINALAELGNLYINGQGTAVNFNKGLEYLGRAARANARSISQMRQVYSNKKKLLE